MRFIFETNYDPKSLAVMAKCLRKTVRKSKSLKSRRFGWFAVGLVFLLTLKNGFSVHLQHLITWLAAAAIIAAMLFEDHINGYTAYKRMLKGTEKAKAFFDTDVADVFVSETEIGKSEFSYNHISHLAETDDYFVFVFSESHAQIYAKNHLTGGTAVEFRQFITAKTDKSILFIGKA